MAKVTTNFDFSTSNPSPGNGGTHTSTLVLANALRPELYNEYERVMGDLSDAIGEVDFTSTLGSQITNLTEAINEVVTRNTQSITTNNLKVNGSASLGAVKLSWKAHAHYVVNDLVVADNKLYKCITEHTASGTFPPDIPRWVMIGGGGGTTKDIIQSGHGFQVGEVLFFYDEYKRAKANNSNSLGLFVVTNVADNNNFTIMQSGFFDASGKSLSGALVTSGDSFEPNTWYYLSESENGKLTVTEPILSNQILYAVSEKTAFITGYRPANVTKSQTDSFVYVSGQPTYELSFRPDPFAGSVLSMGGEVIPTTGYSFNGNLITLVDTYTPGITGTIFYLHSYAEGTTTSLEPYVFTTSGETSTFTLNYPPASKEYTLMFVNGQGFWDYDLSGEILYTHAPIPADSEVRIIDIRSTTMVTANLTGVSDGTIPGDKIQQNSIQTNRLSYDIQAQLPMAEGFANWLSGEAHRTDITIDSQEEFDAVMSGTIPINTSIFLKKRETPYILKNEVGLSSNVSIISDGAVVNRGTATARFSTTYKNSLGVAAGGAIGDDHIHTDNDATGIFVPGDIVSFNWLQFYTVTSVSTTTVNIYPNISTTAPINSNTLYSCQQNIYTEGWIFDGQNNVHGLGGSFTSGFSGSGGAFSIEYCANSTFKAEVRNCQATDYGGAYYGNNHTYNNIIENISYCTSTGGGGCCYCYYSTISNISYCTATDGGAGGGCNGCSYSTISNISYCTATDGGGCHYCYYSTISNISYCTATDGGDGGGCHYCNYSTISSISHCSAYYGGGCHSCNNSTISNINNCSADGGGGCHSCHYSNISNIYNCSAGTTGGGCHGCNYCNISNIAYNTTNTNSTGACHGCNNCYYHGSFYSNTNTNSTTPNITSGGTSLAMCIAGAASAKVVTTQGTWVNW